MREDLWVRRSGDDLWELVQGGGVTAEIPETTALYLWKRNFRAPGIGSDSQAALMEWIDQLVTSPYGAARGVRVNHFIQVDSIELRGTKLDERKSGIVNNLIRNPRNRRWLVNYLEAISDFSPALYVGETGSLPDRVCQHLRAETDFGAYIESTERISWSDLDLHYCALGGNTEDTEVAKEARKALEYITAMLTVAGHTSRPG